MFYLNTIEQVFLFVEQLDQLEVCLLYSRLLTGIPILAVFYLWWNSNKTSLGEYIPYPRLVLVCNCDLASDSIHLFSFGSLLKFGSHLCAKATEKGRMLRVKWSSLDLFSFWLFLTDELQEVTTFQTATVLACC